MSDLGTHGEGYTVNMSVFTHRAAAFFVCFVGCLALLPGCVVQEIRDEMKATNAQLDTVKSQLDRVDSSLATANAGLASTNSRLDRVEQGLSRIDNTNSSLATLERDLMRLGSIDTSLTRLDAHLAAVRKTIGSINSMIPFFDIGGGGDVEPPAPPQPAAEAAAPDAQGADPAPDATPARRDGLIGPWIRRFPAGEDAVLLLPENRFIRIRGSEGGSAGPLREETGRWSRDATTLTLTPESPAVQPSDQQPAAAASLPQVQTYQILNSSTRSVTLRAASGEVLIFARP
jgi:hypothetical protein